MEEKIKDCIECAEVSVSDPEKHISYRKNLLADPSDLKKRFFQEVIVCVDSLFCCVSPNIEYTNDGKIDQISFKHDSSVCAGCVVKTTGVLHLNTSIPIMVQSEAQTPATCSLIFQWESRYGTLQTPNTTFDHMQQIKRLPIFIDFLPAFEIRRSQMSPSGHMYQTFLIPKYCNFRFSSTTVRCWKKSLFLSEIHTIANKMTNKHRRCYRMIKLLLELMDDTIWYHSYINQYEVKTMVLHHSRQCLDTSEDSVNCVLRILHEVQLAHEANVLQSFHSHRKFKNISPTFMGPTFQRFIFKLCSVSANDSLDMFVRKIAAKYSETGTE